MSAAYLEKLNDHQRLAVEHGVGLDNGKVGGPLLIIAGAGSGKTNTLAHRVAHLIVNGADPLRILLMTFSRRAASEMGRRVERICSKVLGDKAGILTGALAWAGTFHGIGARLLRDYAEQIGLDPQFTIHDREDSADLMNLVRHECRDRGIGTLHFGKRLVQGAIRYPTRSLQGEDVLRRSRFPVQTTHRNGRYNKGIHAVRPGPSTRTRPPNGSP
jgi:superfamily I DNA/RNA helicase